MGKEDIRRLANALGIGNADQMNAAELILSIQHQEGELPCFSEIWSFPCRIGDCPRSCDCSSRPAEESLTV